MVLKEVLGKSSTRLASPFLLLTIRFIIVLEHRNHVQRHERRGHAEVVDFVNEFSELYADNPLKFRRHLGESHGYFSWSGCGTHAGISEHWPYLSAANDTSDAAPSKTVPTIFLGVTGCL